MASSARALSRALVVAVTLAVALLGVQSATTTAAHADRNVEAAAATVCYDASQAGVFQNTAHRAASIWNGSVSNVGLSACGTALRIYQVYGGGSRAYVYGLGRGVVYIDYYQAQRYSPLRIMTHEIGHILGLPDNYNGDCSILMSGGSAGTGCTNPYPSYGEAAQVDRNFAGWLAGSRTAEPEPRIYLDSWPAATPAAA